MFVNKPFIISVAHNSKSKCCCNEKPSTYYFYVKTTVSADFQIYISVPLMSIQLDLLFMFTSNFTSYLNLQSCFCVWISVSVCIHRINPIHVKKQSPELFYKKCVPEKFHEIHRKTSVPESLFLKNVADLSEILKNTFSQNTYGWMLLYFIVLFLLFLNST